MQLLVDSSAVKAIYKYQYHAMRVFSHARAAANAALIASRVRSASARAALRKSSSLDA
jgi:hypothetical protein